MKRIILFTLVTITIVMLTGCMLAGNTQKQDVTASQKEIIVETTPTVKSAQIPGCPNKVTAQDWMTIFEMESCMEVKHQRTEWKTIVSELGHYDSDMICALIQVNADKTIIDTKIFYKKPCKHAKSYSLNLEFVPPIKDYLGQGEDKNYLHVGDDNETFWTFPNEKGVLEATMSIASDGQSHKIIPILTCIYDDLYVSNISYIKADGFYGKTVYVK